MFVGAQFGLHLGNILSRSDASPVHLLLKMDSRRVKVIRNKATGLGFGLDENISDGYPVVGVVLPNSPAAKAGLHRGDKLASINGEPMHLLFSVSSAAVPLRLPSSMASAAEICKR